MKNFLLLMSLLFLIVALVGCGGGQVVEPEPPAPTPEEMAEMEAMGKQS